MVGYAGGIVDRYFNGLLGCTRREHATVSKAFYPGLRAMRGALVTPEVRLQPGRFGSLAFTCPNETYRLPAPLTKEFSWPQLGYL